MARGTILRFAFLKPGLGEFVEREEKGLGVSRSQNVVYVMPHDWASIAHFLAPLLDRIDAEQAGLQLLVVTADAESAAAVGAAAVRLAGDRPICTVAATSVARATRMLAANGAGRTHVLAGDAATLLDLARASALKLESVRAVAIAWADELLALGHETALESLLADFPKDAARIIVTGNTTAEVDALVERYARRARRVSTPPGGEIAGITIEYATGSLHARLPLLRRVLDHVDPAGAVVYVRSDESAREVSASLASLGYGADGAVRVTRGGSSADLVVLFDLPASREELREAIGPEPQRVVAFLQPRQLDNLRALTAGGSLRPLPLSTATSGARSREESLRTSLRAVLERGEIGRELLTLEPLLDEHDGIEIAAALLRMLDDARAKAPVVATAPAASAHANTHPLHVHALTTPRVATSDMKRMFLGIGARDNARPGDLVGAITGEAGITSDQLGRVDIRESHSIVEVANSVADAVIAKTDGMTIRGRRVTVREDVGREDRPTPRAPREDRPPRESKGGFRGGSDRPKPRRDDDRPARPRFGGSDDRPARPRFGGGGSDRPKPTFRRDEGGAGGKSSRPPAARFGRDDRPASGERDSRPPRRGSGPPSRGRSFDRGGSSGGRPGGSDRPRGPGGPKRPPRGRD
jgi:ATP-dependent RNA helicase DeaD